MGPVGHAGAIVASFMGFTRISRASFINSYKFSGICLRCFRSCVYATLQTNIDQDIGSGKSLQIDLHLSREC